MRFRVNDAVRIAKNSEYYRGTSNDPKEMDGEITLIQHSSIQVKWENGTINYYNERDLRLRRRE